MIRSVLTWALTWGYMVAAGLVSLPIIWLTGRLGFTYRAARLGLRLLFKLAGVRIEVKGALPVLPAGTTPLYMANHQSNLDPPILVVALPGNLAFLAKKQLFSVPILGTVLKVGGLIPVARAGNPNAARAIEARAAAAIRAGRPFIIFPEGTRSRDGSLLEFKKGPFYLAELIQAPVVPVRIEGSGALMAKGSARIRPGVVTLRVYPPIEPGAWADARDPRAALAALVRERLAPLALR
ncbi:MAG: 1-acyl-sn-glycerol-3-phosphate acyltransferase [Acidobacteria bacterium]|nr:MAG: 1-acyl-sn-glycerol-3-phosphate acyltransferase [Acidobacteriota bacterium]